MQVDYPYHVDSRGRTAETGDGDHVRDLIEQVLFTLPGERVNRPTFGSGLMQLVFAPNSDTLAAATQVSVQASLQQWLGSLVQIELVKVDTDDATLVVVVQYIVRRTQERRTEQFTHTVKA